MTPKIDRQLNLVIPIERGDGVRLYAHSTPIDLRIFDAHFAVIAKTFSEIYGEGLGLLAGPRVAAKILRRIAEGLNLWDTPAGQPSIRRDLFEEIRRLTNVFAPGEKGWEMLPLDSAAKSGVLDEEDVSEVENFAVFFTVIWRMHKKSDRKVIMEAAALRWGGELTSSNCTAYRDSLPTSTPAANTGASPA